MVVGQQDCIVVGQKDWLGHMKFVPISESPCLKSLYVVLFTYVFKMGSCGSVVTSMLVCDASVDEANRRGS